MTMRIHGDKIEFPDGTEQFTASSGGGGEAQPPVAFNMNNVTRTECTPNEFTDVSFKGVLIDTDKGVQADSSYIVQKSGTYSLSASVRIQAIDTLSRMIVRLNKT